METTMKWTSRILVAGLIVLGLGMMQKVQAAASTDTITISVTPGVTYSVAISSPFLAGYNFGTVNLNTTTLSTVAITVQNTGTVTEYFGLALSNSTNWSVSSTAVGANQFTMAGYFNTAATPQPGAASVTTLINSVTSGMNQFNQGATGTSALGYAYLCLKMGMPNTSGFTGQQTMVLSITGQPN